MSINWALQGFFDLAAVAPLLICGKLLAAKRGLEAILAFSISAFIHFRAFFFAPLVVVAVITIARNRQWVAWRRIHYLQILLIFLISACALYPFSLVWPWIGSAPTNSSINVWTATLKLPVLFSVVIVWLIAIIVLTSVRAWQDLFLLCWFFVMLISVREMYRWHVLIPMAWLGLPINVRASGGVADLSLVRDVRIGVFLFMSIGIYNNLVVPNWLRLLI
jgi:hypothetical protein